MNRELFSLRPSEPIGDALGYLVALGIGGSPVLDDGGKPLGMVSMRDLLLTEGGDTLESRMTQPVVSIREKSTIYEAARLLGETGYHRLVVVDEEGRAIGIVSSLDVIRGLVGLPASHPPVFPHYDDTTNLTWTDDTMMEFDRVEVAPDGPGVLVLIHGSAGKPERIVWAESTPNVRSRLIDMLSAPESEVPGLKEWLDQGELRFRAAYQPDAAVRDDAVETLWAQQTIGAQPGFKN